MQLKPLVMNWDIIKKEIKTMTTSIWIFNFSYCEIRKIELSKEKEEEFDEIDNVEEFFAKYADTIGYDANCCTYLISSNELVTKKL